MYSQLGDIIFEGLYGENEFTMTDSVSLPTHERVNRRPKQQLTGVDLTKLKLTVLLNRSFIDVESAIDKFTSYRNTATHLRYVTGSGNVIGTFIIKKTKQKRLQTTPEGDIVLAELTHELVSVVASNPKTTSVGRAIASSKNSPPLAKIPAFPIPSTIAVSAALQVSKVQSNLRISEDLMNSASSGDIADAQSKLERAKERVLAAKEAMADAAAKVQQAQETAQQAQGYVANMYVLVQNAQTMVDYIDAWDANDPIGSLNNVNIANAELTNSLGVMTNTSQPLAGTIGARK